MNNSLMKSLIRAGQQIRESLRTALWLCLGGNGRTQNKSSCVSQIIRISFLIVSGRQGKASPHLKRIRLLTCQNCHLYNESRKTCGTAGPLRPALDESPGWYRRDDGIVRRLGCWCYMPFAAGFIEKNCWLYDETGGNESHWPMELNGTKIKRTAGVAGS